MEDEANAHSETDDLQESQPDGGREAEAVTLGTLALVCDEGSQAHN